MNMKLFFVLISICFLSNHAFAQSCEQDKDTARSKCSRDQFAQFEKRLAEVNKSLEGKGVGTQAREGYRNLDHEKADLESKIAVCNQARKGCIESCRSSAQQKRSQVPSDEAGAQQDDSMERYCKEEEPAQNEENAKKTSSGMGEALQALAGLLAALGSGEKPTADTRTVCQKTPNDPTCLSDKPITPSKTDYVPGQYRNGDRSGYTDSGLGGSAGPAQGAPVAVNMSAPMPGGGGGGASGIGPAGMGSGSGSGSKKGTEDDGSPKLNLSGGGVGGGGGRGGGGAFGGMNNKGAGNGPAGRVSPENDPRMQAAVDKALQQRGLASDGPLGGITSAHSLDNFQKVEKRIQTERNLLNEH